jgi:ketosteroid isomerase-like protein
MAFLAVSLFVLPAQAQDKAVRAELEAVYAKMVKATQAKDLIAMMRLMAPNYEEISLTGKKTNQQEAEASRKEILTIAQSMAARFQIQELEAKGSTARVKLQYTFTLVTLPKADPQGKSHKIVANSPLRHTWTKTAKGWLLQKVEELKGGTLNVDGKPQLIKREL